MKVVFKYSISRLFSYSLVLSIVYATASCQKVTNSDCHKNNSEEVLGAVDVHLSSINVAASEMNAVKL